MAYPIQVTLGTGNKVSLNYQSQEVSVTLTYQLEREDGDVLALVQEKTRELAQAHQLAWQGLHEEKLHEAKTTTMQSTTQSVDMRSVKAENVAPASIPASSEEKRDVEADSHTTNSVDLPTPHLPTDEWTQPKAPLEPATLGQRGALRVMLQQAEWTDERIAAHLQTQFDCERIEDLNASQAAEWLLELQRASRLEAERQRLSGANPSLNGVENVSSKMKGNK